MHLQPCWPLLNLNRECKVSRSVATKARRSLGRQVAPCRGVVTSRAAYDCIDAVRAVVAAHSKQCPIREAECVHFKRLSGDIAFAERRTKPEAGRVELADLGTVWTIEKLSITGPT